MLHPDYQVEESLYHLRLQEAMLPKQTRVIRRHGQRRWLLHQLDRLLCELDHHRVVLAQRLERYDLVQSILHADEASKYSSGHCS